MSAHKIFFKRIPPYAYAAVALCVFAAVFASVLFFVQSSAKSDLANATDCQELVGGAERQCFVEEILSLAKTIGITPAIRKAEERMAVVPSLQYDCHGIMHAIGEEAYGLYTRGVPLDIDVSLTLCTYGFYHGFISASVLQEGSFKPAQAFCAYINAELLKKGINAESECYHGFGHAVVDDHVSMQFRTAHEVADHAFALCDTIALLEIDNNNCRNGVFNALANIFQYKLFPWPEIENEDPFHFCEAQMERTKLSCYGYFARVHLGAHNGDLREALASIEALVPEAYRREVIQNIAVMAAILLPDKEDIGKNIEDCMTVLPSKRGSCLGGLAVGVAQSVPVSEAFLKASAVCLANQVKDNEKADCFENLLTNIKPLISQDDLSSICRSLPLLVPSPTECSF